MPCCWCSVAGAAFAVLALLALAAGVLLRQRRRRRAIAFFHPYCNAGGGGERVLWLAVQTIHRSFPSYDCYVYTGDGVSGGAVLEKARKSFGVELPPERVRFVHLTLRPWVEAGRWPVFTMLGQSLGSVLLGLEAIAKLNPEVYVDSMGYAFTLPLFRLLGGCRTGAYVHYPTISTDMLQSAAAGGAAFNNRQVIARSRVLTAGKLLYYRLFARLYGLAGSFSQVVMVNSSWTRDHIRSLWAGTPIVVYPPCNVTQLVALPLEPRSNTILSIAQFRPEKNHGLQVQALALLLERHPDLRGLPGLQLVMCGGCRDEGDRRRVAELVQLAKQLGVSDHVTLRVDIAFPDLLQLFGSAVAGLHTMANEHFGIGVVELLAAGVIPVAHDSAGPRMDIVPHPLGPRHAADAADGLLASTAEEYAEALAAVLRLAPADRLRVQRNGRAAAQRFSDELFAERFRTAVAPLLP